MQLKYTGIGTMSNHANLYWFLLNHFWMTGENITTHNCYDLWHICTRSAKWLPEFIYTFVVSRVPRRLVCLGLGAVYWVPRSKKTIGYPAVRATMRFGQQILWFLSCFTQRAWQEKRKAKIQLFFESHANFHKRFFGWSSFTFHTITITTGEAGIGLASFMNSLYKIQCNLLWLSELTQLLYTYNIP